MGLTVSKLILMLPTLVAPTGTMLKKPYRHRPSIATRSLSTKRFCNRLAMYGETENSSPENNAGQRGSRSNDDDDDYSPSKCRRFSTTQAVGLWKRW